MRPEWWGKFVAEVSRTGRIDQAAGNLGIFDFKIADLFGTDPECRKECGEAIRTYRAGVIDQVIAEMGKGLSFRAACAGKRFAEEGITPREIEGWLRDFPKQAALIEQGRAAPEQDYEGPDAVIVVEEYRRSTGKRLRMAVHQPGCPRTSSYGSGLAGYRVRTSKIHPEDFPARASGLPERSISQRCPTCGGLRPKARAESLANLTVRFRVARGQRAYGYRYFATAPQAEQYAREHGIPEYVRMETFRLDKA